MRVELKNQPDKTLRMGGAMVTPMVDREYWVARVTLFKDQSVVAFPKFGTIGIGFAIEDEDWNTNLPYTQSAEHIADHIWVNHKYKEIKKSQLITAIKMLQEEVKKMKR